LKHRILVSQAKIQFNYQKAFHAEQKRHAKKKVRKGTRRMPWLSEAMKDVISCDKHRGLANMN
jgi:hypothetical protein